MKWIKTYKIHLLMVGFALAFLTTYTLYMGREMEIEQLRNNDRILRQHIISLNERIELMNSYPYEHSQIK